MFFFWGGAWVMASKIIESAASLELDAHLAEQRLNFRRSLHDDLGNTLCGLHFKIQSLEKSLRNERGKALDFIVEGYGRAERVLDRLLTGFGDTAEYGSLKKLRLNLERDFDIRVTLSGRPEELDLSPEVMAEVLNIVREAATNSAKHSGGTEVAIKVARSRRGYTISVSDQGSGFKAAALARKQESGSLGIRNMKERTAAIGGRVEIDSRPGAGTTVRLDVRKMASCVATRDSAISRLTEGNTYLLLVWLKIFVLVLVLVQMLLLDPSMQTDHVELLVAGLIATESLACLGFRSQLHKILTRQPWLLILDVLFFCLLFFISWRAAIPVLAAEPMSMAIVFSAYFLGVSRNLALAMMMGVGLFTTSILAPPDPAAPLQRTEMVLDNIMDNLVLAMLAATAIGFIRSLDSLRTSTVARALSRQKTELSATTHRNLHDLVHGLRESVSAGESRTVNEAERVLFIANIESRSSDLKQRVRKILQSLEEAES